MKIYLLSVFLIFILGTIMIIQTTERAVKYLNTMLGEEMTRILDTVLGLVLMMNMRKFINYSIELVSISIENVEMFINGMQRNLSDIYMRYRPEQDDLSDDDEDLELSVQQNISPDYTPLSSVSSQNQIL